MRLRGILVSQQKFAALKTIKSSGEYNHFFNVCSKCFVESIENYGKDQGNENYFRNDIKASYPALFEVLRRINLHAGLLSGPTTHETRAPQAQAAFAYKASGYAALRADSF